MPEQDIPDDFSEQGSPQEGEQFNTTPLSNRSSKAFVITLLVLILAVSIGGALIFIDFAREAQMPDDNGTADTIQVEREPPDPSPER